MSSDNIDSVEIFYGNGTVYVSERDQIRTFHEYNFDIESLRSKSHGEYWVTDEIIVALGCDVSRKKALKLLRRVVKRMKSEIEKGRRYT
jgi:molybdopterin synthase catalytic subunit